MINIGICGGGIGGFGAAIALRKFGHNVHVFEKAPQLNRIGADINLTPNAVFALDQMGLGEYLRKTAARPSFRISRDGITGEETSRLVMSDSAQEKYGAPQLTIHRADLLQSLRDQLPDELVSLGACVQSVKLEKDSSIIIFDDGSSKSFDLIIGADGIHSAVRKSLFGADDPVFTGIVSYRAVFDANDAKGLPDLDSFTKWWGKTSDKQIVTFPLTLGEEIFVFATTSQADWTEEGWTLKGDVEELREAYKEFHPNARALLENCKEVTKSALYVREALPAWSEMNTTLLGDAAHPMVPFMAQGACMAIEDAVVLARCLENANRSDVKAALIKYEAARKPRTTKIQVSSLANEWMKKEGNADWVYGYNAWQVEL